MSLQGIFGPLANELAKRAPGLLVGAGVTGMFVGGVWAVFSTPAALANIKIAKDKLECECMDCHAMIPDDTKRLADHMDTYHKDAWESFIKVNDVNHDSVKQFYKKNEKLDLKGYLKATWKNYVLPLTVVIVSAACIFAGVHVNAVRYGALSAAYVLAENQLTEYKNATKQVVGEKEELQIRNQAAENLAMKSTPDITTIPGKGPTVFCEAYSGWMFRSDVLSVQQALNDFAKYMRNNDGYGSLSELHEWLCPDAPHLDIFDQVGFCDKNTNSECEISSDIGSLSYRKMKFGQTEEHVGILHYYDEPVIRFIDYPNEGATLKAYTRKHPLVEYGKGKFC